MASANLRHLKVWDGDRILQGTAREVLERIRLEASRSNEELGRMSVDQYARSLIEDAPYFVSKTLLKHLERHDFESDFDRALAYLTAGSRRIRLLP